MTGRWNRAVGILAVLLTASCTSGPPPLQEVPHPDLSASAENVQQQIETTRANLTRSLQDDDDDETLAAAFGEMGMVYHAYEQREAALACYGNAAALSPETFRWVYYLGHLHRDLGAPEAAVAAFERALELRPDHLATLVRLAQVEFEATRLDRAESLLERALEQAPDTAAAHLGLGRIALARKEFETAVEELETARRLAPEASEIHYPLGLAYRGLGDLAMAEAWLGDPGPVRAEVPDPEIAEVQALAVAAQMLQDRGTNYFREGLYDLAEVEFRRVVETTPDDSGARTNLGLALIQLGRLEEARDELEQAIVLDPADAIARYNLGTLFVNLGRDDDAVLHLQAAIDADDEQLLAHYNLGNALRRQGRFDDALPHYRAVVEKDPGHVGARLAEALTLLRLHRYPEARERLDTAYQALPDHLEVRHVLVRVLVASPVDEVRDGKRAMELAKPLATERPPFRYMVALAMLAAENGHFREALQIQQGVVQSARQSGATALLPELEANLARYREGQAARRPWPDGDPVLSPPSRAVAAPASGP